MRMTRRESMLVAGALVLARPARADEGALAPLLAARLKVEGVALAAGRLRGGKPEFAGASVRGPQPDADSVFEIGSITKTFTALLLADAVVRGALKLDDPVEAVLPDGLRLRDSHGQPLRWRDLATHRSGLPRLPGNLVSAGSGDPYADYDWASLRLFLKGWQPRMPRDTAYAYSNLGFGLLGHALAMREGTDYATLLTRRVLAPLGLSEHIGFSRPGLLQGHDAQGKPVPAWHFQSAMAGAGALHGSARGLVRYGQAAIGGYAHPLREAFALCLQRHAAGSAPINPIGLAWLLAPDGERMLYNHDGATAGFSGSLWLDPARESAAVVLANAQVPVTDLSMHILDASLPLLDRAALAQPSLTLTPAQLQPLAGVYAMNPQFKLRVRADGVRLFAQATGQGEFELFAKATRRFFARVAVLEIEFDADDQALTLHQGGAALRFVRE